MIEGDCEHGDIIQHDIELPTAIISNRRCVNLPVLQIKPRISPPQSCIYTR